MRRTAAVLIAAATMLVPAPAAATDATPRLPNLGRLKYRPPTVIQGAHGAYVRMRWGFWGQRSATGYGVFSYSDAYDHFRVPIKVHLDRPRPCGERMAFTRVKVTARRSKDARKIPPVFRGAYGVSCTS